MTDLELSEQRRSKWHLDGQPVRTLPEAREFIDSVGFCLMYPEKRPVMIPTFLGAWAGDDGHLPTWQHAFEDARAHTATELMVRLLRDKAAFEANLFGENIFLVSAGVFPYFYGLVGDRNPRQGPKAGPHREYSPLARDAFEVIRQHGAINKSKLRDLLGDEPSPQALDHALGELWSRLRITRVDYKPGEGAYWDTLFRWAPDAVRTGIEVSIPEALSALVCKYLDCMLAAELGEITEFLSHFVSRSKINEAVNALLAARELSFVPVGNGSKMQMTPPRSSGPHPALGGQRRRSG
jgi:Winged helix DNA-binding domain